MLDSEGFDLWADGYDRSVSLSEAADSYPFAGYKKVLGWIYGEICGGEGKRVLDLGFGTGVLLKKLYDRGYTVTGVDFSPKMIEKARKKMPEAKFVLHDLSEGVPAQLSGMKFDHIVCTYAIHHLNASGKRRLINELLGYIAAGGSLLIGDVAFETGRDLELCREQSGGDWDEDEMYPVAEQLTREFPGMRFVKMSFCSGVFEVKK